MKSLYTYIINMGNLVASADDLYIHRNTMNYRLSKIQELISVDIYNRDYYMTLYFSYKILVNEIKIHLCRNVIVSVYFLNKCTMHKSP